MTNREQSVLDAIDELVDEQMAGGEPIGGYDYNDPGYPRCPHCHRDWHGLAITERIERMRWTGTMDADYRYAEDDSPVLCPGSEFIGPVASPSQLALIRHPANRGIDLGETLLPHLQPWQQHLIRNPEIRRRFMAFRGGRQPWVTWNDHGEPLAESEYSTSRDRPHRAAPVINNGDRVAFVTEDGRRLEGIARVEATRTFPEREETVISVTTETPTWSIRVGGRRNGRGQHADCVIYDEAIYPVRSAQNRLNGFRDQIAALTAEAGIAVTARLWCLGDPDVLPEVEPTPQQRALPRPSTTPPMWANDPARTRRTRNHARSIRTPRV